MSTIWASSLVSCGAGPRATGGLVELFQQRKKTAAVYIPHPAVADWGREGRKYLAESVGEKRAEVVTVQRVCEEAMRRV